MSVQPYKSPNKFSPYSKRPLCWWAAGLVAGIFGGAYVDIPLLAILSVAGLVTVGVIASVFAPKLSRAFLPLIVLAAVLAGFELESSARHVSNTDISKAGDHIEHFSAVGTVTSDPEIVHGVQHYVVQVGSAGIGSEWKRYTGNLDVLVPADRVHQPAGYGDSVRLLGTLELPLPATNPGMSSYARYLSNRGIYAQLHLRQAASAEVLGHGNQNWFLSHAWRARRSVIAAVDRYVPESDAVILLGVLIGDHRGLSPEQQKAFERTGTVHILATAGLHVASLAIVSLFVFRLLTVPRQLAAFFVIVGLWWFAFMAGGRPAVVRAVIAATVLLMAIVLEREPDLPTTLAIATMAILGSQPTALFESGFQMSFLAVAVIAAGSRVWNQIGSIAERTLRIKPARTTFAKFWEVVGLTILAQLGAAPIVAISTGTVSLCGIPANTCVVPLLPIIVPLGLFGSVLVGVVPWAGRMMLQADGLAAHFVGWSVNSWSRQNWAVWEIASPSVWQCVAYYVVLLALLAGLRVAVLKKAT